MHADKQNQRGWLGIYTKQLDKQTIESTIKRFSTFGDVRLTEIDVSGTNDTDEKANAITALVDACVRAGCKSVDLFETLRFDRTKPETFSVFNEQYERTQIYESILKTLLTEIQ